MPDGTLELAKNILPVHGIKKISGKQIILTLLGLIVLLGGLVLGVILVKEKQIFREKAYTSGTNPPTDTCDMVQVSAQELTPCQSFGLNGPGKNNVPAYSIVYTLKNITSSPHTITYNKNTNFCSEPYGQRGDTGYVGCWSAPEEETLTVTLGPGEEVSVPVSRSSPTGESCGSIQTDLRIDAVDGDTNCHSRTVPGAPTMASVCQTGSICSEVSAQCLNIKAFDANWNQLSVVQLSELHAGDIVRFVVAGQTNGGTFDKARFTINGTARPETTLARPNSSPTEFYDEYTIPAGTTGFTINAQLHHSTLGWF